MLSLLIETVNTLNLLCDHV